MFANLALPLRRIGSVLSLCALALGLASGCRASATPEEVAAATLFFPPVFRYVAEPKWSFSDAERLKALQEYTGQGADTLLEMIIDPEGKVVRVRILRTRIDEIYHEILIEHARAFTFSAESESGHYRTFYYPIEYRLNHQFEWQ